MMRKVIVLLTAFLWASAESSGPVYDQRQEGGTNVHAQLENVVVLLVPPQGMGLLDLVALASRGVGGGKPEGDAHRHPYRAPEPSDRHHTPEHTRLTANLDPVTPLDDMLQRDPDYEQVKKQLPSFPSLPTVNFSDAATTVQETTMSPTTAAPSSSSSSTSTLSPSDDVITVKDVFNAHSPKLALYSQFRSASQPSYHKKNSRASR